MGMNSIIKDCEAILALGGNLGDVRASFTGARSMLDANPEIEVLASSPLYQSPPMGPQDQADYLNAVILIRTTLPPLPLLHLTQTIELHFGRKRDGLRWGERTLDIDLIAYDDTQMQSHTLTLPHPGMQERMFVLQPMNDIRPDWRHPASGISARQLLQQRIDSGDQPLTGRQIW